jgi:hypothetical protein
MFPFSLKTALDVFAGIWINLTSAWFGTLLVSPTFFGAFALEKYWQLLTINALDGIVGLTFSLWLTEKSKAL